MFVSQLAPQTRARAAARRSEAVAAYPKLRLLVAIKYLDSVVDLSLETVYCCFERRIVVYFRQESKRW